MALGEPSRMAPAQAPALQGGLMERLRSIARRILRRGPRAISQHPFDAAHAVDTSGLIEAKLLLTGHLSDAFSTAYFAVPPSRFQAAIAQWESTLGSASLGDYAFVDIGCGKGRAVLLVCAFGFREILGVELHPGLAEVARTNLHRWGESNLITAPAKIMTADAATVVDHLADGPVLIYLYNPFRAPVLRSLLGALLGKQQTRDAPVDVLYLYPEEEHVFAEFPAFTRVWHGEIPLASGEAADGISAPTDPCSLFRLHAPTPA